MNVVKLERATILKLFNALSERLGVGGQKGELYLVGGAVLCLALNARAATQDVDALFLPSRIIREAAKKIAHEFQVSENWLNDGVKGFLRDKGEFQEFLDLKNLKVYVASPQYLLAMKCLSMRLGEEFHDLDDVRFLLRYLNIESYEAAKEIMQAFYPLKRFPQKTLYVLEELLG